MAFLPAMIPYITAAGAGMSAISAIKQGRAAKAAAEFNANIARENADIARQSAADQVRQFDRNMLLHRGAVRVNQAKAGGAMEGSVLDILADTAAQGELQRQDIIYQGELKARGFENTATLDVMGGQQAKKGSVFAAGTELLMGSVRERRADGRTQQGGGFGQAASDLFSGGSSSGTGLRRVR